MRRSEVEPLALEQIQPGERTQAVTLGPPSDTYQPRTEIAATVSSDVPATDVERSPAIGRGEHENQLDERGAPASLAVASITAGSRELQLELSELKRRIAAETRRRDAGAVDPRFEALIIRQRELRERRADHIEQALTDPPEHLTIAIGPPPEDRIARQRWELCARQIEALRFESGSPPTRTPAPIRGPARRTDLAPPKRRRPSLGR